MLSLSSWNFHWTDLCRLRAAYHIDPAVASGPLITTINDLVAVVVYYGLAAVVLIDMFHLG